MNKPLLTSFQRDAEFGIRALLEDKRKTVLDREIYEGMVPFYSTELQRYVRLTLTGLEVWLFDNEASFSGSAGRGQFERCDYGSEADVLEALLQALSRCL